MVPTQHMPLESCHIGDVYHSCFNNSGLDLDPYYHEHSVDFEQAEMVRAFDYDYDSVDFEGNPKRFKKISLLHPCCSCCFREGWHHGSQVYGPRS